MKRVGKIFICLALGFLIFCMSDYTAEAAVGGSCGSGISWSYENGTLTISGNGRMNNMSRSSQPWRSYMNSITNIVIEEGITYIGAEAFYELAEVKTASLPNTLTEIGYAAFCWCEGLQKIEIPGSVKIIGENAFWCCLDLEEIKFNEGLVEIKDEAFTSCRLIERLYFPKSLEKIGYWAFGDCTDLLSVSMPGIKDLGASCFSGCTRLISVDLGRELENIKTSAFAYCYALGNVVIPGSVDYIGDTAFYSCSSIGLIKFTGSVPEISGTAFAGVGALGRYPECNTEWESVIGNGFGGSISWEAYSVADHDYSESIVEETCLRWGYTVYSCNDCSSYYMSDYNPALGHDWNEGVVSGGKTTYTCLRCGEIRYEYSISGSCGGGTYWNLDTEEGILNIKGNGSISSNSGFKSYKESIRHVIIEPGITSIGPEIFFEFENIESIEIPDTVNSIGMQAFVWCRNIKEIIIPEGVRNIYESTFWGCESLENLVLPSTITSIGEDAFYACRSLKKLVLPDGITSMAESAFWACYGLEEINIPKGMKEIPVNCFSSCTALKKVILHDKLEIIGEEAFDGCSALAEIEIPESVRVINDYAFWGCSSLKNVVIPGSVMNFGNTVFGNCAKLSSIKFTGNPPEFAKEAFKSTKTTLLYRLGNSEWTSSVRQQYGGTVTWKTYSVVGHMFTSEIVEPTCIRWGYTKYSCIDCNEYYMENYLPMLGHEWDEGTVSGNTATYTCLRCGEIKIVRELSGYCGTNAKWRLNTEEGILKISGSGSIQSYSRNSVPWNSYKDCITKVIIEPGITGIGNYAFYEHFNVVSIEIPETVKSIGLGSFAWCQLLEEIHLPEGITKIPEDSFWACRELKAITLPSTLTVIEQDAFYHTAITSIDIPDSVKRIGEYAFWYCTKLESVKIPAGVKVIERITFSSCSSLKTVILHDEITEIQESAFSSCSSLSSVNLPKKLKKIGESAFGNTKISKITIPENVGTIEGYVFGGYLKEIRFLGKAPEFDAKTFNGISATAYYPQNSASWKDKLKNYGGYITWISEPCGHFVTTENVTEGTCIQEGYTEIICSVCGYSYISSYSGFGGHVMGEWETIVPPTETEFGEQQRMCIYCDYCENRKITAEGYVLGDINLDGNVDVMDSYYIRLVVAKLRKPTEKQISLGDVDLDGKITAIDANIIRKYAVKIIEKIPVSE